MRKAIIVGGSLTGLASACMFARAGFEVTVLERSANPGAEGAGLGVYRHQLSDVTGFSAFGDDGLPVITTNRESTNYQSLYRWFRACARRFSGITLINGCGVTSVESTAEQAIARTIDGETAADLLIGADGRSSIVRKFVSPEFPEAIYAGYALWRGLISERDLPPDLFSKQTPPVQVFRSGPYRLVAYLTPGVEGEVKSGQRAVSFAWYDGGIDELLKVTGCIDGKRVIRTLRPDEVTEDVNNALRLKAVELWPEPWLQIILATLESNQCFVTPIAEYLPLRLVRGRIALIGDAAHVASPMTGAALATGIDDVIGLRLALSKNADDIAHALHVYEGLRLKAGRSLVASSMDWSQRYLRGGDVG
jgi:2-polyprenyl-6-methoxyphenol hydroxylase-like FAD-dependent oxidoreductase